jgi:hypothetical protein
MIRALATCLLIATAAPSARAQILIDTAIDTYGSSLLINCAYDVPDAAAFTVAKQLDMVSASTMSRRDQERLRASLVALRDSAVKAGECKGIESSEILGVRGKAESNRLALRDSAPIQPPLNLRWGYTVAEARTAGVDLKNVDSTSSQGHVTQGTTSLSVMGRKADVLLTFGRLNGLVGALMSFDLTVGDDCEAVAKGIADAIGAKYPQITPKVVRVNQSTSLTLCDAISIGSGALMYEWRPAASGAHGIPSSFSIQLVVTKSRSLGLVYSSPATKRVSQIAEWIKNRSTF